MSVAHDSRFDEEFERVGHSYGSSPMLLSIILGVALSACGGRSGLAPGTWEESQGGTAPVAGAAAGGQLAGRGGAPGRGGSGGRLGWSGSGGAGAGGALTGGGGAISAGVSGIAGTPSVPEPLWRVSYEPLCDPRASASDSVDVWSDSRGVYVLAASSAAPERIYFNPGTGWTDYFYEDYVVGLPALTGIPGGPLVEYGTSPCSIHLIETGMKRCSGASNSATFVFIVNSSLGYAVYRDRLLVYDGLHWTQLGGPLAPAGEAFARAVWANSELALIAADESRVYVLRPGSPVPELQMGLPEGNYTAAWGFAADDLWVANSRGQIVHYDGRSWSVAFSAPGECSGILGLWGAEGRLFYHTRDSIGVLGFGQARTLETYGCDGTRQVRALWGNSSEEVFAAVEDYRELNGMCGTLKLMWFNGSAFGPL